MIAGSAIVVGCDLYGVVYLSWLSICRLWLDRRRSWVDAQRHLDALALVSVSIYATVSVHPTIRVN